MKETWYVLEDDSLGDPHEIARDEMGRLRHKDGRAVAYASHGPRSRGGVDASAERAKAAADAGASPPPSSGDKETDESRDAVAIPEQWRDMAWPALSSLASRVSADPIRNKVDATKAVEAALARRAAKAEAAAKGN